jgi:thiosulfate reductase cytochrome b subunit
MRVAPADRVLVTPLVVRIWHWVHALGIVALLASGAALRFPERIRWFGDYRNAVAVHDVSGVVLTAAFALWIVHYGAVAGRLRRVYLPTLEDLWPGLWRQAAFYFWGFFKGAPHPYETGPERRFNPLQKISYGFMMLVMTPLVCASGILLLDVTTLRQWLAALGGLKIVIGAHFLLGAAFLAFLFVHVYLSTMGRTPGALFRTMWTGWEEKPRDAEAD